MTEHGPGSGWIPGCSRSRCRAAFAESSGWAVNRLSLMALAVALEHLVGDGPDPYAGPTPELDRWFKRHGRAAEMLAEVANRDATVLRSLAGPPHDDDGPRPPGVSLLVAAAIHAECGP